MKIELEVAVVAFFRRLFGSPKRDGQALLNEALDNAIELGSALQTLPDLAEHMAVRGMAFTEEVAGSVMAGIFLTFGENALKDGRFAKQAMDSMQRDEVDFATMHEVEYLFFMAHLNDLLVASGIADEIAAERDQMAAFRSLYADEDDPRGERAEQVIAFGKLAFTVRAHRGLQDPDYVEDFLERSLREQIPEQIAKDGARAFANVNAMHSR